MSEKNFSIEYPYIFAAAMMIVFLIVAAPGMAIPALIGFEYESIGGRFISTFVYDLLLIAVMLIIAVLPAYAIILPKRFNVAESALIRKG